MEDMMNIVEYCNRHFEYNPESGLLTLKFPRRFERAKIGDEVGCLGGKDNSYKRVYINGRHYKQHRLIWMMVYGEFPDNYQIDHKDRNGLNNRIDNLRLATASQNSRNRASRPGSTSRFLGVSRTRTGWVSAIGYDGFVEVLGHFQSEGEAAHAYNDAAIIHHGEFSNLNEV